MAAVPLITVDPDALTDDEVNPKGSVLCGALPVLFVWYRSALTAFKVPT